MATNQRLVRPRQQLAEAPVAPRGAVGGAALVQDLLAVGREQAARAPRHPAVVQRRDDRLSGPRSRDNQVPMVAGGPLGGKGGEHVGLMRVRVQPNQAGERVALRVAAVPQHPDEAIPLVGLEGALVPVLGEGGLELP